MIEFRLAGRHLRSVYRQLDGEFELGDVCTCRVEWDPFRITRRPDCPIDVHRIAALQKIPRPTAGKIRVRKGGRGESLRARPGPAESLNGNGTTAGPGR